MGRTTDIKCNVCEKTNFTLLQTDGINEKRLKCDNCGQSIRMRGFVLAADQIPDREKLRGMLMQIMSELAK
jgi:hypothetical protein